MRLDDRFGNCKTETGTISLIASMGIGIFVSTFARNLQQALLVSFFVLFPVMFLSGTIVPVESMPQFLQYLSLLSPVRYYMEISLGIFLKGVGWDILWPTVCDALPVRRDIVLLEPGQVTAENVWIRRNAAEENVNQGG